VFIASHLLDLSKGPNFGPLFAEGFDARLTGSLRTCGAEVMLKEMSGIDLETDQLASTIEAFRPDTMMVVHTTHTTVTRAGEPVNATFGVDLYEPAAARGARKEPPLRAVWRSSVQFTPGGKFQPMDDKGKVVAAAVIQRLEQDGFFPGCASAENASTKPVETADTTAQ
jgi:hypothetical protein